jgi:hypothetical protein
VTSSFSDEPDDFDGSDPGLFREELPGAINWNLLDADTAEYEWADLNSFVLWLKTTFGLPPSVVPPLWHRHPEMVWELSALHTHFLSCYGETASPSAPIAWMRDFAEARVRLRDWVAICGTRLDRDRPTRQTVWPGEATTPLTAESEVIDRDADFTEFVRADVQRRAQIQEVSERDAMADSWGHE